MSMLEKSLGKDIGPIKGMHVKKINYGQADIVKQEVCSRDEVMHVGKVILTVLFIHTSDYLRYLRRKQTVTSLPITTPEKCNCTTL